VTGPVATPSGPRTSAGRPSPTDIWSARPEVFVDFDRTPFTTIWEVTRACSLRCVHCRADAMPERHPLELTTEEGRGLLDQIAKLGSPVVVLTGGDPLERPDLFDLAGYGIARGLSLAVTPSGTPRLTPGAIARLAALGVRRIALSLDGPDAAVHDRFRQQPGSYDWTLRGARAAVESGLVVQINTTVTRHNVRLLDRIAERVEEIGAAVWSAFFLVTVGRGRAADQLDAGEYEQVFSFLYDASRRMPFAVRTTAAPHYRRFVLQQQAAGKRHPRPPALPRPAVAGMVGGRSSPRRGVTDGNGLVFISHTGEVYPSGFLPLRAGNVRQRPLSELYRDTPLFRRLRDADQLGGKCGRCEFRRICGGSRARAYAVTGDPLAADPCCAYEPGRAS
jgi:radical SAM protein